MMASRKVVRLPRSSILGMFSSRGIVEGRKMLHPLREGEEWACYDNAGCFKIYDDAMLWILVGFVLYPYDGLRFQVWGLRQGYGVTESFDVWPWLWKRQMDVWRSL